MSLGDLVVLKQHWAIQNYVSDKDALATFANNAGYAFVADRFGYLNQFSNWRISKTLSYPFPASGSTMSFDDIVNYRAADILNLADKHNKELYIMYSGGVDSTLVVISLLWAAKYKDILHIVFTDNSIEENPTFYKTLEKEGIDLINVPMGELADYQLRIHNTDYTVTGWCGDQLFGSIINQYYPDSFYFSDWREWVREDTAIQQFESAFTYYGLPIKTFGEFTWFMNFSSKWNIVKNFDTLYSGIHTGNMISFFDHPYFEDWCVSNFDVLHRYPQQDTAHYKVAIKKYIYKYTHDDDYYKNKGKIGSWAQSCPDSLYKRYYPIITIITDKDIVHQQYPYMRSLEDKLRIEQRLLANKLRFYRKR